MGEIIRRILNVYGSEYERKASVRARRLGLNTTIYSGEDAVCDALARLWEKLCLEKQHRRLTMTEDLGKMFEWHLHDAIREEWRRQGARKRGGRVAIVRLSEMEDDSWHPVLESPPTSLTPIERRETRRTVRRILTLLDHEDRSLREILRWRRRGATLKEISSIMLLSPATIKRRIEMIRSVCKDFLDVLEAKGP